jgi:predicted dehydrogenase
LKIGLIGCGDFGRLRAGAIKRLDSLQLVAVSDVDRKKTEAVTEMHGGVIVEDWRKLMHKDVDAVIVSTPPHLHADMCTEALAAGKHVLCEKPLARTPDECQRILNTAKKNGCFLATGFNYRFYPSIQKAKSFLEAGMIGELDHIRSYAGYSAADHGQPWVHDVKVVGGGALRDNGIHLIDLTCYFLGEVEEIKGFSSNTVWGFEGCEDNGFVLMRSTADKIASLHASWTEWGRYKFVVEIYGTLGVVRSSCFPMVTTVVTSDKPGGRIRKKFHFFPFINLMEKFRSYRWLVEQSLIKELKAFYRAIRGESSIIATGEDGKRAVEIANSVSQYLNKQEIERPPC